MVTNGVEATFKAESIETKPWPGQKPGTSGLRKRVSRRDKGNFSEKGNIIIDFCQGARVPTNQLHRELRPVCVGRRTRKRQTWRGASGRRRWSLFVSAGGQHHHKNRRR